VRVFVRARACACVCVCVCILSSLWSQAYLQGLALPCSTLLEASSMGDSDSLPCRVALTLF